MKPSFEKYIPFKQIDIPDRTWPNKVIDKAPIWCSVDLRDGNQALVDPMNLEEKLEFFHALCDMGFKRYVGAQKSIVYSHGDVWAQHVVE